MENSTDRGAWQATVHEVAKSQTRLSMDTKVGGKSIVLESIWRNHKERRQLFKKPVEHAENVRFAARSFSLTRVNG